MGIRKTLGVIVALAGFSVGFVLTAEAVREQRIYNRYHKLTMATANTDGVGLNPDVREMASLYCDIGKQFDPTNPARLTIPEMERYLDGKGIKTDDYGRELD